MLNGRRIVAVGLLTQHDLDLLGPTFDRLWPVDDTPCFSQLLDAIDEADRQASGGRSDPPRRASSLEPGRR